MYAYSPTIFNDKFLGLTTVDELNPSFEQGALESVGTILTGNGIGVPAPLATRGSGEFAPFRHLDVSDEPQVAHMGGRTRGGLEQGLQNLSVVTIVGELIHKGINLGNLEMEGLAQLQLVAHTQVAGGSGIRRGQHIGGQIDGCHLGTHLGCAQSSLEARSTNTNNEDLSLNAFHGRLSCGNRGDSRTGSGTNDEGSAGNVSHA